MNPLEVTGTAPAVRLSDLEQQHLTAALEASRSANTRRAYRSAWAAWSTWCANSGHSPLPAAPEVVASYLGARVTAGASSSTVSVARAAIRAAHRDAGATDPTAHDGLRRAMKGLQRTAAGRGRGQAHPFTADDLAAVLATADLPRRTGRGMESDAAAAERGAVDKAVAALLFQGGLRRSEAAALRWQDVTDGANGGVLVRVSTSKTNQDGSRPDVRYLKNGAARAVRELRTRRTVQASGLLPAGERMVLDGLTGQSVARRFTAAAKAAGVEGQVTGHSGRVGLAVELTRRGAPEQATARAGGWKSSRMVTHYSAGVAAEQGAVAKYL